MPSGFGARLQQPVDGKTAGTYNSFNDAMNRFNDAMNRKLQPEAFQHA